MVLPKWWMLVFRFCRKAFPREVKQGLAIASQQFPERFGQKRTDLVVTPELSLCGYPPEDLVLRPAFIDACASELAALERFPYTADPDLAMPPAPGDEGDALAYDAAVPAHVRELARKRRAQRARAVKP